MFKIISVSIAAHLFLILILYLTKRINHISFSKKESFFLIVLSAFLFTCCAIIIFNRDFIYHWDYSLYFNQQLEYQEFCSINQFLEIPLQIIRSIWYCDYSYFINAFTAIPYALIGGSNKIFNLCILLDIIPYLVLSFALLLKTLRPTLSFYHNCVILFCISFFPLLFRSVLYGQPDMFGVIFCIIILTLCIPYHFEKTEVIRYVLIFASTLAVISARRWYMYFVVGWFPVWAITILIKNVKCGNINYKNSLSRLLLFGFCCLILGGIILFPMIRRILLYNYSVNYAFYAKGGFWAEFSRQENKLGAIITILLLVAIVRGLFDKEYRPLTLECIFAWLISVFGFTRIQGINAHQSLALVPIYITFFIILGIKLADSSRISKLIYPSLLALLMTFNSVASYLNIPLLVDNSIVSNCGFSYENRTDYQSIYKVNSWLLSKTNVPNSVYVIPHADTYNGDVFRNNTDFDSYALSRSVICYGSAVPGTHYFANELLTARFVLTVSPFDSTCIYGLSAKYNDTFLKCVESGYFSECKRFTLDNEHEAIIYERILPASAEELSLYKNAFAEENEKYPHLYSRIWKRLNLE